MLRIAGIWTLAIVVGLFFVLAGFSKLAGPSGANWAIRLSHWGYPAGTRYAIGGVEMLSGVGLLTPSFRRWAAVNLAAVMLGAFATHLLHGEFPRLIPPLVLGGLLYALFAWQSRAPEKASRRPIST
jgi:uncharacterized membrane protein YphA (DoxX/SURF4 family)